MLRDRAGEKGFGAKMGKWRVSAFDPKRTLGSVARLRLLLRRDGGAGVGIERLGGLLRIGGWRRGDDQRRLSVGNLLCSETVDPHYDPPDECLTLQTG